MFSKRLISVDQLYDRFIKMMGQSLTCEDKIRGNYVTLRVSRRAPVPFVATRC